MKDKHPKREGQSSTSEINQFYGSKYQAGTQQTIGTRGLRVISGRVDEEYLVILKSWTKAVKIYLEMQDDVTVGTMLDAIKLPLLKAKFEVIPANPDVMGDMAAAQFLDSAMHSMDMQTWKSHVTDALEAIDFGFAVTEIILEKREDGKLWLKNIDPRGQETLERWEFEDDKAVTFVQRSPIGQELSFVPLDKSVHFTFRGRKGNPQGKPLLRSIYRPWRFSKDLENLEGIGIERDIGGMPIFTLPVDGTISPEDITKLKATGEAFRMDEAMYGVMPPGVEVNPYGGGSKMYDVAAVIDRKKKEILGRMFAQFLMLGMGAVGTQALVKGSQDFFTIAIESIQEMLLEAWNLQLVPYLFSFNSFPGMTGLPKIEWLPPGREDIAAVMNAISSGVGSRMITPTDEDEDNIRERLDLAPLPADEKGEPREPEAAATPGVFDIRKDIQKIIAEEKADDRRAFDVFK